ncbi:MAG: hypothetical protein FWC91_12725 [Defluviitaleaceae bacterium]|nr:hypothetical protein [Defluviitaleaceae bacterium]
MNIEQFIAAVKRVDWYSFGSSIYYIPENVPNALIALALADKESKEGIYHIENIKCDLLLNAPISSNVMFAIGNDHCGSYYPAVREALPFIVQVALLDNHLVAKNCATNILIDLYHFCSDSGDKNLETFVKGTIRNVISSNRENFTKVAVDDARNKSLIESLMSIVDEVN